MRLAVAMRARAPRAGALRPSTLVLLFTTVLAAGALVALVADRAGAMPAFARRYGTSCASCHAPFPRLGGIADMFAGHGFRMAPGETPSDTIETGDALLALGRALPLAVRFDAHAQLHGDGPPEADFQTPYGLKLLSSAPLSKDLSYYFYFFLYERGEVGGVEDAFVMWNDVAGRPVDLVVGQFQVSDPLFKRELRLAYDDYVIYRARVGDQPTDLTYDRGAMAIADVAGFTVTAMAVNGNGRAGAQSNRRLDDDPIKNVAGHVTRDLVPGTLRAGAFGYFGAQDGESAGGAAARNRVWMAGADATLGRGPFELNLQFLHREDDAPTFDPAGPRVKVDGGFAEALWVPEGSRWYGFALYNLITADRPLLDPRMGGASGVDRYETIAGGAGYLLQRNARLQVEGFWDFEAEEMRWTGTIVAAY
uniref:Uncharacterized protein n=1 Tax=Eiseniibacteriota bacterium TaxID=2212470 RepID=A0A832MND9_UNCEI